MLCGGLVELMKAGYETLVDAGYAPEMAYFECVHEVKLIVDLIYEGGIANMNYSVSNTAEYGEYVSGPRVIDAETQGGDEAHPRRHPVRPLRQGLDAGKQGQPDLVQGDARQAAEHPIEQVGAKLRAMMPWIKERALVDTVAELIHGVLCRDWLMAELFGIKNRTMIYIEPAFAGRTIDIPCLLWFWSKIIRYQWQLLPGVAHLLV